MYVRKYQVRIIFKGIENPIAMVYINVEISHSAYAITMPQSFNYDPHVIKDTESRSPTPSGMMQTANGL